MERNRGCLCLKERRGYTGSKYDKENWLMAGEAFGDCGALVEEITDRIIRYYCDSEECLEEIPGLFLRIRELAEKAFEALL